MNTNRLSKDLEKLLNRQIINEAQAAQLYLSFGVWADGEGFSGISNLLFRHSLEERDHMMKVIEYMMSRDGDVIIGALSKPKMKPENIKDCFEKIYKHERENTKAINEIVTQALEEKDWATWNFGQWFVKEQIEEENLAVELLDKLKLVIKGGSDADSLYDLDKDIGNMSDEAKLARDVDSENP